MEGNLATSVYHKKTHTDRYLHFRSLHHPQVKTGMISCLRKRAERVCTEGLTEVLQHLSGAFQGNGYPRKVIHGVLKKHGSSKETKDDEQRMLVLPYIKGLNEKIRLACRPLSVKTVFRSSTTLRNLLTQVKTLTRL